MEEAKADGWTRNPKYRSMPEQMLRWRAATRLIGLYMPEVLFGLGVKEEADVRPAQVQDVTTPASSGNVVADLNRQIAAAQTVAVTKPEVVGFQPVQDESVNQIPSEMEPADVVEDPF